MLTYVFLLIASLLAVLLPIAGLAMLILLVNANKTREFGFLHYIPYCMLLVIAADVFFSGRVANNELQIIQNESVRNPISGWMIRFSTVIMLAASLERLVTFLIQTKHPFGRHIFLSLAFILFWIGSVGLTSVFSEHPSFSHEYVYTLVIGLGILSLSKSEIYLFLISLRNAFLLFLLASFLMIFINPLMVLQTTYSQGYIPGLPRMYGLAAHSVTFGVFTLSFLILIIKFPFKSGSLQKVAYLITILGLVLAQSKTVWVTMLQVFAVLVFFRVKSSLKGEALFRSQSLLSLVAWLFFILCLAVVACVAGGLITKLSHFIESKEGAQLLTLTGRDIIWDFALSEWKKYPWLGYGPSFLNFDQRLSIGLINATHAHNQFVDLLSRSGLVGFLSVFPYLIFIIFTIFRLNDNYRDLAIVAFLIVLNRCVSEVPLSLYGYGHEFLIHLFMLAPLLLLDRTKINRNF